MMFNCLSSGALFSLIFALLVASGYCHASDKALSQQQKEHKETITQILNGKDFNQTSISKAWRLKDTEKDEGESLFPEWIIEIIEFFEQHGGEFNIFPSGIEDIAALVETLLWVVFIIVIIVLIRRFRKPIGQLVQQLRHHSDELPLPASVAGMDVTPSSLPADVVASASHYWQQQQHRNALSLLYRASLSHLLHDYKCPLSSSYTEEECLAATKALQIKPLSQLMSLLTRYWQQLAYGHKAISTDIFEQLCQQWHTVFVESNRYYRESI